MFEQAEPVVAPTAKLAARPDRGPRSDGRTSGPAVRARRRREWLQRGLAVGAADDHLEAEADRVADAVIASLARAAGSAGTRPTRRVSTRVAPSGGAGRPPVEVGRDGGPLGDDLDRAVRGASGRGVRLDPTVRTTMESAFGADFSAVRVHRDSKIAPRLGAAAFTVGSDVHFSPGQYAPSRRTGQWLLSHELTHVVQQTGPPAGRDAAARVTTSDPKIQRLVGFEVELSVPTFGNAVVPALRQAVTGGVPNPILSAFFGGGLGYGAPIGNVASGAGNIDMSADHNRLQRLGLALYNVLAATACHVAAGWGLTLAPPGGYVPLSNLEYGTPALDEMAAGSNAQFQALATAIDNHAAQIIANNPANTVAGIPNAGGLVAAGTPVNDLTAWLGAPLPPPVVAALAPFQAAVAWDMYVQATAGVLPTGLDALYQSRAAAAPGGAVGSWQAAKQDASNAIVNGVNGALANGGIAAAVNAWMAGPPGLPGGGGDRAAFKGGLLLGLSYAIGNALNQTTLMTQVDKNAVPLLVKVADTAAFTNQASTNWLRANPPPPAVINGIAAWFHFNVPQVALAHWLAAPYNAAVAPVVGSRGPILVGGLGIGATANMLTRILNGAGGTNVLVGPGTALGATDPVSAAIGGAAAAGGQTGMPVEFRWIHQHPNAPGQLWNLFQQVLAEVRTANLEHVPLAARGAIMAAW